MGQFSWLDCVTHKQIVDNKRKGVFLLVPAKFSGEYGNAIFEKEYDGYGNFGGYDVYDLIADWNKEFVPILLEYAEKGWWTCDVNEPTKDNLLRFYKGEGITCEKRWLGIVMACYDEDNFKLPYPIKITYCHGATYEHCIPSETDPNQGWED